MLNNKNKVYIIIISTVITFLTSYYYLNKGVHIIYQNLYYIPIILSCYWFRKNGFLFSIILSLIHFIKTLNFYPEHFLEEVARIIIFIVIAMLTYKSSEKIKMQQVKISELAKKMYEENEKIKITISSIGDGVISTDNYGKVTFLNNAAEKFTGWSMKEAMGMSIDEVINISIGTTRINCESQIKNIINNDLFSKSEKYTLISKDGFERIIGENISPIKDYDGNTQGTILVLRDITEITRRQDEIYYMSYRDSLTGLYNRRFFEEEINRIDTERNLPISIIMVDLNGLKLANDAFGHHVGDELIKKAADSIKIACRGNDIAARWGGDEFTILLPKTNNKETEATAKRINKVCSDLKMEDGIIVSISFGFDTKEIVDENIYGILKKAEQHMYKNKVLERNDMVENIINNILYALYEKNPIQEIHSLRVSELSKKIGIAMNLSESDIYKLKLSGLMHDIGNIAVDDKILDKLGEFAEQDINEMKTHTEVGYRILSSSSETVELAQYVLHHHERYDGYGYPKGLKKEEIPLFSRIISIADFYDVLTSKHAFNNVLSKAKAIQELIKNKGTQFDPLITDIFIDKVLINE